MGTEQPSTAPNASALPWRSNRAQRHSALKILHCISSADPRGGGPIEGIKQQAVQRQSLVEVVTLDDPNEPAPADFPAPLHRLGPARLSYRWSPRLIPWLRENRHRYDIVVVNGIWQFNSFAVRAALHGTDTPYVVFTHGMLDPWFRHRYPLKHLKKWLYWPWGDYRVLRDADAVLFTSEEERLQARKSFWLYRCRERVISYGTAAVTGDPQNYREAFWAQFPALRGRRLLLFLGRIHEKKGGDLLLDAFAESVSRSPAGDPMHLVIAGPDDSPFAAELKQAALHLGIADRITWTGMVTGTLKWGAFHAAEAFILPSHQENFGISVAEALACGTPVLISNQVNIWREIAEAEAGLIENDDLPGTIRLLQRWDALTPEARQRMRENATRCFHAHFEIQRATRDLVQTLQGVLDARQKAKTKF